ncbi:MAG: helix-hairpin-helix domain-containing protein [Candidatus Kapaibacterium sp.]
MNIAKQIAKIQTIFGASKFEVMFASLILAALTIGQFVNLERREDLSVLTQELESYNSAMQTSFIGIDNDGNVNEELALGDTVIKKKSKFPEKKKEEKIVGKININTASKVQLMKLKGIGEKTAEKIIDYRSKTPFNSIEDIQKVKGIGPKKFESMKEHITV